MLSTIAGFVRSRAAGLYSDGEQKIHINPRGDQCVAQSLPQRAELVRLGDSWATALLSASAFTYVNAWPTTRSEFQLYNGDPEKCYIIDAAWMCGITSIAAAQPSTLLAQVCPPGEQAAPTPHVSILRSLSGKTAYSGRAIRGAAVTTALANGWMAIGSVQSPMTTNLGHAVYVDLYGTFVIPPGGSFNLAGLSGTAAGTAICGVVWHEVVLPINR